MLPFLRDGDLVRVAPRRADAILAGEVVCYAACGALFLHRVVRRRARFVIKGDAVAFTDVVAASEILGTVVAVERDGRVHSMDTVAAHVRNRLIALFSPLLSAVIPTAVAARHLLRRHRG